MVSTRNTNMIMSGKTLDAPNSYKEHDKVQHKDASFTAVASSPCRCSVALDSSLMLSCTSLSCFSRHTQSAACTDTRALGHLVFRVAVKLSPSPPRASAGSMSVNSTVTFLRLGA
eukprot:1422087-Amphidinium_carterae.1